MNSTEPSSSSAASGDRAATVDFGEVASESVHESVVHEREITAADDLDPTATEPFEPVGDLTEGAGEPDLDQPEDGDGASPPAPAVGEEEVEYTPPTSDKVMNSITAAIRR